MPDAQANILVFGAFDRRKPRVRLLIEAIRRAGALEGIVEVKAWEDTPETNVPSRARIALVLVRMVLGYPLALARLVRAGRGGTLLLPYPGIVEILLLAPIARLLGRVVVLDAFLPIHDTLVGDRGLLGSGLAARAIWHFERFALGRADIVLVDTDSHGDYFACEFGIPRERFETVLVGAEPIFSPDQATDLVEDILGPADAVPIVLFYGQLIPLHGVETIICAAQAYAGPPTRWILIGRGQLEPQVAAAMDAGGDALARRLEWIPWVDYVRLPSVIARARLCLGIFGTSNKAARVIPNKLFQQVAMGKPVITRQSPAVDDLARAYPAAIRTVPPGDPAALAQAVAEALSGERALEPLPEAQVRALSPDAGVERLIRRLAPGEPAGTRRPAGNRQA